MVAGLVIRTSAAGAKGASKRFVAISTGAAQQHRRTDTGTRTCGSGRVTGAAPTTPATSCAAPGRVQHFFGAARATYHTAPGGGTRRAPARPRLAMQRCCDPYAPLRKHPELFHAGAGWREEWLSPALVRALKEAQAGADCPFSSVLREEAPGIYSFDLFQQAFCEMFLEEVDNYYASGLPIRRPNSMNNYGIIVNEIGLRDMMTRLQQDVLWPIARSLYPREGSEFHDHHSFMVQYKQGQDLGLDMHTDDSDVTFNVCLGRDFTGAGLTFCGIMGSAAHRKVVYQYQHVLGRCLVHLGAQRHGADDIVSGERNNLIIWNHNFVFRESPAYLKRLYEKEAGPPDQMCLSYTHDRDYGTYKEYPEGKEKFKGMSWCPPKKFCYDKMEPIRQMSEQKSETE